MVHLIDLSAESLLKLEHLTRKDVVQLLVAILMAIEHELLSRWEHPQELLLQLRQRAHAYRLLITQPLNTG